MGNDYFAFCAELYKRGEYKEMYWQDDQIGEEISLSTKQCRALKLLNDKTTKWVGYGGAARGGKSLILCIWLLFSCYLYPGTAWIMGRLELVNLKKTTLVTFLRLLKNFGFVEDLDYTISYSSNIIQFSNGSKILLWDTKFKPSDKLSTRYGSLEITGAAIDESNETALKIIKMIGMRVGSLLNFKYDLFEKVLECFNPDKNHVNLRYWLPFKKSRESQTKKFVRALPSDNPGKEAKVWLEGKIRDYKSGEITEAEYQRLIKGNFDYDDNPLKLIKQAAALSVFTNTHVPIDFLNKYMTTDIAMHGSDHFVLGIWYGRVLMQFYRIPITGGKYIVDFIKDLLKSHDIPEEHLCYDADGLGSYLGKKGGYFPNALAFNGASNSKRIKKENYVNLKAICGHYFANRVNRFEYWYKAIQDDEMQEQVTLEFGVLEGTGMDGDDKKTGINKKEEQKKMLDGKSPDILDMSMMREAFEIKGTKNTWTGGTVISE